MPDLIETFADGVATLTMNRPEARNALSGEMMAGLQEAIPRLGQDPKVRAAGADRRRRRLLCRRRREGVRPRFIRLASSP